MMVGRKTGEGGTGSVELRQIFGQADAAKRAFPYRWGPVSGRNAVPTLVHTEGYFFPTSMRENPQL